jgi:hypothetical protein
MENCDMDWPVVPLCDRQRLDVRNEDVLEGGLYRRCIAGRAGAGYDRYPAIVERRFGIADADPQFVVQLGGCPLDCWYCYVTEDGVHGAPAWITSAKLLQAFADSRCRVFHLMGGAPALLYERWQELALLLPDPRLFHSDFLCVEKAYDVALLRDIPGLHAVNVKNPADVTIYDEALFWRNLERLVAAGVEFYLTYTNFAPLAMQKHLDMVQTWFGKTAIADAYDIGLRRYKACEVMYTR